MGGPMAGHLANADWAVRVYNRSSVRAQAWVDQYGGSWSATPAEAVRNTDFICCCVADDAALRAVATGPDGAFAEMKNGFGLHRSQHCQRSNLDRTRRRRCSKGTGIH